MPDVHPGQTRNLYSAADTLSTKVARRFEQFTADAAASAGRGSPIRLTDEEWAKLASLGYVSGLSAKSGAPTLDPKDVIELADQVDRAKELNENRRFDEAIALADDIIRRNPDNVPAHSIRGQALLSQKRYGDAAAAFGTVVARNPSITIARFDLGSSFAGAGETAKAEAEWRKAIELEPHFAEPRASLIAAHLGRGETAKALALSKDAAASGAESPELCVEIGLAYANSRDFETGQRWFESALRLRPAYVSALSDLGRIAYEQGRIDEALARYRAASEAAPGESLFLKQIAAILLNDRKDTAGALAVFRAALAVERDPGERAKLDALISGLSRAIEK